MTAQSLDQYDGCEAEEVAAEPDDEEVEEPIGFVFKRYTVNHDSRDSAEKALHDLYNIGVIDSGPTFVLLDEQTGVYDTGELVPVYEEWEEDVIDAHNMVYIPSQVIGEERYDFDDTLQAWMQAQ